MRNVGVCRTDDIALSVLTTVIGHQAEKGWAIVDAGWMAMSRDRGTARMGQDFGYGKVCTVDGEVLPGYLLSGANQEHGIVSPKARPSPTSPRASRSARACASCRTTPAPPARSSPRTTHSPTTARCRPGAASMAGDASTDLRCCRRAGARAARWPLQPCGRGGRAGVRLRPVARDARRHAPDRCALRRRRRARRSPTSPRRLAAAGSGIDRLLQVRVYVDDIANWSAFQCDLRRMGRQRAPGPVRWCPPARCTSA